MNNIRYYRNDIQLGEDLLYLAAAFESTSGAGNRLNRKISPKTTTSAEYEKVISMSKRIISRLKRSSEKNIPILINKLYGRKKPLAEEILIISIIFDQTVEDGTKFSFSRFLNSGLKNFTPSEKILYTRLRTADSHIVKRKIINTEGQLSKDLYYALIGTVNPRRVRKTKRIRALSQEEIFERLDKKVIGQARGKEILSQAASGYIKALSKNEKSPFPNILLMGPSGSGKTHLLRTLSEVIDVPFYSTDATKYTATGYVGADIMEMVSEINSKIKKIGSKGCIVFIDEIDKTAYRTGFTNNLDVGGGRVQEELLKILDRKDVQGKVNKGRLFPMIAEEEMDTSKMLFVCAGAFQKLINTATSSRTCGFITKETPRPESERITTDMLIDYGMMPELLGRLPVRLELSSLNRSELYQILKTPVITPIEEFSSLIPEGESFSDEDLMAIASNAENLGLGARGLVTAIEEYIYYRPKLKVAEAQ